MTATPPDLLERIRQQFDAAPYPRIPLEQSPKKEYAYLYTHNLVTPYYFRHQKVISTEGKLILDVGCGSGYTSLVLAEANPGARIVGMDISEKSIDLSRKRLAHYGFDNVEFHVMGVEDLPSLGMKFDYINCDEVLYLLLDPIAGLKSMREVLAPDGIIRANFHSSLQRTVYLQIQRFAEMVGLMTSESQEEEISFLRDIMRNLKPGVWARNTGWKQDFETNDQAILANHLLRGDKGWTIPDFFFALKESELDFISMVQWKSWDLINLFSDISELPIEIGLKLAGASKEEQLYMYELLNPSIHRLLDMWFGHPGQSSDICLPEDWEKVDWDNSLVHLHPQLLNEEFRNDFIDCVAENKLFDFSNHLAHHDGTVAIDTMAASCLLSLLDGPQVFEDLSKRWLTLRPVNPINLEPSSPEEISNLLAGQLKELEQLGYILLEKQI
jgi:2-polyprenyl-3-methyl-5-hydroxy-6-metoxy-1,4-benzoquinol methylase